MKRWYKECPYCKNEIKKEAIKCQYCHELLESNEEEVKDVKKECPFCLNMIDVNENKCPFCDEYLNKASKKSETKSWWSYTNSGGMSLTLKIVIWSVFVIFWIIFIWNLFSSSTSRWSKNYISSSSINYNDDIIDYNDALIDASTNCINAADKIPDDITNLSSYELKSKIREILNTCQSSLKKARDLWWWKWDYSFQNIVVQYLEKREIFLNQYLSIIDYLYSSDYSDSDTFQIEYQKFQNQWADVDNTWNEVVRIQKEFANKYNYRLDYK